MKAKLLIGFLITLLVCGMATASVAPFPMGGQILAGEYPVMNAELEVLNLNTGAKAITETNRNGWYQVDLPNFDPNYRGGDILQVTVTYCRHIPECVATAVVEGGGAKLSWDVKAEKVSDDGTTVPVIDTPLPDKVVIVKYVCWDDTPVENVEDCPEQPVEPEEDKNLLNWAIGIVVGFLVTLLGRQGLKFYNGKVRHIHRGIRGYHDPNDRHRDASIRHTLWKDSKIGCLKDVDKIAKGFDLDEGE
jgi:hypothetical protein